jgi:rubrerythrin
LTVGLTNLLVAKMQTWSLNDISWDSFDASLVDPDIVPIIKAASVVEFNADDYRHYLNNVLDGDRRSRAAIKQWSLEEIQHGRALGKWAELADPLFNFESSYWRFVENFTFTLDVSQSVRGSRVGELVARCMVETGTSSFYSALGDATDEPVLKELCCCISEDEFAHYQMFYAQMSRYLKDEDLSLRERLRVAFDRIAETEDDELATAYWAANRPGEPFDRRPNSVAYARGTLRYYQPKHIRRMIDMVFNALGLNPSGPLGWAATRFARAFIWYRGRFTLRAAMWASRLSGADR